MIFLTLLLPRAPKGQLFHSPGQRPGYKVFTDNAPCKGNSNIPLFFYSCPYRARWLLYPFTQGDALGCGGHWAFSPLCANVIGSTYVSGMKGTLSNIEVFAQMLLV